MLPWQPFLAFFVWGVRRRHLANATEPSMCGGDAALCQITLTTCYYYFWAHQHKGALLLLKFPQHNLKHDSTLCCEIISMF